MPFAMPDYLSISPDGLGQDTPVNVRVRGTMADIARDMAEAMLSLIQQVRSEGRQATLIVPVGPVDQFPVLADRINTQRCDCSDVVIINMDEYVDEQDQWVEAEHPLSFRGYMDRKFYNLIDPLLAPKPENRVFPDPRDAGGIQRRIRDRGGVDACFGGIGINGHIAFNEPPEPDRTCSVDEFAALPTRVLDLSRETRTINSVTVGGEISVIPHRAITVGMQEILASRKLRFYCNRPWQSSVVRRVLHGPVTSACPASLLRTHPDAELTIADYVAALPDIRLR
ncbi:MAG: glucosamine-6-phosphate isomerase [Pirellulaceae bacterium]